MGRTKLKNPIMKKKLLWNQTAKKIIYKDEFGERVDYDWLAKREKKYWIFYKSKESFIKHGAEVLEESVSLFHSGLSPIRYFSVDELNKMNVECQRKANRFYKGFWDGRIVLFYFTRYSVSEKLREIVVGAQMSKHENVHKLLGCCLETPVPVLVYEWVPLQTLQDRILLKDDDRILEWKDRLRIAWEISHVISYLHNAFSRPIIHTDVNPAYVLLDHDNTTRLGHFGRSITIPEGEEFVKLKGGSYHRMYAAPEYQSGMEVSEGIDVYSFGVLFLMLLSGKNPLDYFNEEIWAKENEFLGWIHKVIKDRSLSEILDPAITKNGVTDVQDIQLKASVQLSLLCVAREAYTRPTMVEVATQLINLIRLPQSAINTSTFQARGMYRSFRGTEENLIQNNALILEKNKVLFQGSTTSIRLFSVDDLNNMNVEHDRIFKRAYDYYDGNWYQGSWEGKVVLVKFPPSASSSVCEIVVATQLVSHNNVLNLVGCCLETKIPALVYEWVASETLEDRILLKDDIDNQNKLPVLEWKDRLRIAWEISNVVSYLHTVFAEPVVHLSLEPYNVFLDKDNIVKLSTFSHCSVPEVEEDFTTKLVYSHRRAAESTDVYAFGVLFLMLLTGKNATIVSSNPGDPRPVQNVERTCLVKWVTKEMRNGRISEIIDPTFSKDGVATVQLSAALELALRCTTTLEDCRPTMVEVSAQLNNLITSSDTIPTTSSFEGGAIYQIFRGSNENLMNNESMVQVESITLFPGRSNPIHYLSIDELNKMKVDYDPLVSHFFDGEWCQGSWEERAVLVKLPSKVFIDNGLASSKDFRQRLIREIVVANQLASHSNVLKLLGCCLETKYPLLVYEWVTPKSLQDYILLKDENQNQNQALEWEDRLKIAGEISSVVSHLHTAFPRPIIHMSLKPHNVFLNSDKSAKLTNFIHTVSIPEGEEFVRDIIEWFDWCDEPEYKEDRRVAEGTDVYSFGILLLVLLTGKPARFEGTKLSDWVTKEFKKKNKCVRDIVDPAMIKHGGPMTGARACMKLALRCINAQRDKRPTMVDVANQLNNILASCHCQLPCCHFSLVQPCLTF